MAQPINSEEFRKRAKRLLEAFVYDYLRKSGCTDTARTYFEEAGLDNWPPEWLITLITKNEITTKNQENEAIKERKKKVQLYHRRNKGEHVNDEDEHKEEGNEERIEGKAQKENNEEIREDTNFKNVKEDDTKTSDARNNYRYSNKVMGTTSTDATNLPCFNKSSPGYSAQRTFPNNELPSIPLPLDVPDGFLNEWWLTFWDLFSSLYEQEHNSGIPYHNSFE
ncbi:hypothetical protein GLOIN_2v1543890 [Rhizophagus clarus]|uniref:LisH domain-containing protein n=1 Tax=Rhizophagus clarus TaxID=94130 RepID=A0A8H3QWZ1_9GLOM|nr:hypothetical protein GLOIN_2v1543890 [Rhizophagus clarus]